MIASTLGATACASEFLVYHGTFTDGPGRGILVSRFNSATGEVSIPELAAEIANPNFLAVSPDGRHLFAASRPNANEGYLVACAIDRSTGRLTQVDKASTDGTSPCYVSIDSTGGVALVANYSSGSVKSFRIGADGSLAAGTFVQHEGRSVDASRQTGPHAHCIVPAPGGRFALACDLGTDRVVIYRLDTTDGSLTVHEPAFATVPPGSGPRHLVFGADGSRVHVVNEISCTISTFSWDAALGVLALRGTVPLLPPGVEVAGSFSAAAIVTGAGGRFVYATVRGHDSVSVFAVDQESGGLSLIENVPCGGEVPRGLGIDPTGRWLFVGNQKSNNVALFEIDPESGRLGTPRREWAAGAPVDFQFVPVIPAGPRD